MALSFVQTAADLERAREIMAARGDGQTPLIAKIERPAAVENIDRILEVSDAVMVARGDLGLEVAFERVPRIQKEITRRARLRGRPVIVATQVFDSMRTEPRPTRAEVSDAANAVDDAVDAIMLTGETAVGVESDADRADPRSCDSRRRGDPSVARDRAGLRGDGRASQPRAL